MKGKIRIDGLQEAIDAFIDSQVLIPGKWQPVPPEKLNSNTLKSQLLQKIHRTSKLTKNRSNRTMINWAEVRAKFPVTSRTVYLNTAAAGPLARVYGESRRVLLRADDERRRRSLGRVARAS
jgi:hypothetical protein